MPSDTGRTLDPRERRTIAVGATLVALTALVTLVIMPLAARWVARERAIDGARNRLAQLGGVAASAGAIRGRVDSLESVLERGGVRIVRARSTALAASGIQSWVQEVARQSRVTVNRLDVAGEPAAPDESGPVLPATVSATGDIYGVTEYLRRLQHGSRLVEVSDVSVTPNPTLRGNLLQLTESLRVPLALEP